MQSRLQPKNWTIRLIIIVVVIVILLISIISNLWYFTDCSEMITPISNVSFTYFFEERETFTSLLDSIGNNTTIEGNAIFLIIISRFYSRMITILPRFGFAIYGLETIFYIYISIEIELAERWKSLAGLLSGLEITKNIRGRLITGVDNKWNVLLRRTRDPPKRMHRGSFEHTRVSPYLVLRSLDLLSFRPKRFHPPPPMVDTYCWLQSDKLVP